MVFPFILGGAAALGTIPLAWAVLSVIAGLTGLYLAYKLSTVLIILAAAVIGLLVSKWLIDMKALPAQYQLHFAAGVSVLGLLPFLSGKVQGVFYNGLMQMAGPDSDSGVQGMSLREYLPETPSLDLGVFLPLAVGMILFVFLAAHYLNKREAIAAGGGLALLAVMVFVMPVVTGGSLSATGVVVQAVDEKPMVFVVDGAPATFTVSADGKKGTWEMPVLGADAATVTIVGSELLAKEKFADYYRYKALVKAQFRSTRLVQSDLSDAKLVLQFEPYPADAVLINGGVIRYAGVTGNDFFRTETFEFDAEDRATIYFDMSTGVLSAHSVTMTGTYYYRSDTKVETRQDRARNVLMYIGIFGVASLGMAVLAERYPAGKPRGRAGKFSKRIKW